MRVQPRAFTTPDGRAYVVRSASPAEAGKVLDHAWLLHSGLRTTADALRTVLQRLEGAANGCFLVAAAGEDVVATLSVEGGRGPRDHVAELGISVHAGWRRQQIALNLLRVGVETARATPALRRLSLEVHADNAAAIRLYESLGFSPEGRRPGHVHQDGHDVDLLLMGMAVDTEPGSSSSSP